MSICNSSISEFPTPNQCLDPANQQNQQIQSACACLATINTNIRGINQYCASLQVWQQANEAYNKSKQAHTDWKTQVAQDKLNFQNTTKRWKNCAPWGTDGGDAWCEQDHGSGWKRVVSGDKTYETDSNCPAGYYG